MLLNTCGTPRVAERCFTDSGHLMQFGELFHKYFRVLDAVRRGVSQVFQGLGYDAEGCITSISGPWMQC